MMNARADISAYELRDLFHPIFMEQRKRAMKTVKTRVVEVGARAKALLGQQPQAPAAPQSPFDVPGSDILFLSRKAPGTLLDEVHQVAIQGGPAAEALADKMEKQLRSRRPVPIDQAVRNLLDEPVFAEFRYGGKLLAQH